MQLDLRQILNGLRKRWWLALIVTITAAAVAYLATNAQPRIYQSQVTLVAQCVSADNGCIDAIQKTMPAYAQQMGSTRLWQQVVDENGIQDVDLGELPGQIKIQSLPAQSALVMTVDNKNPVLAATLADAISSAFIDQQAAAAQQTTASGNRVVWTVTQPPAVPDKPYQPRPTLYAGAAALFGLVLGLLLAIGLELIDTSLKTPADVKQYVELNTIGIIPRKG